MGSIKTYSEEELVDIKKNEIKRAQRANKNKLRKRYPRSSRGGGGRSGGFSEMEVNQMESFNKKKIDKQKREAGQPVGLQTIKYKAAFKKKKLKKGYEAWPKGQQETMQLGINQTKQKRDEFLQELQTEKIGLQEMDKEIQVNIDQQVLKVKASKMGLAALLLDQKLGITAHKHENRVMELEAEIKRHDHNIKHFQKQLDDGRPKPEKKKPEPAPTQEEKKLVEEAKKKGAEVLKKQEAEKEEKERKEAVEKELPEEKEPKEEICIGCGCTDKDCKICIEKIGKPCLWVFPNKCSACFDEAGKPLGEE